MNRQVSRGSAVNYQADELGTWDQHRLREGCDPGPCVTTAREVQWLEPVSPQVVLIISGNLSFLNWLTIVPSLACFDDATLGGLFPSGPGRLKDQVLKIQEEETRGAGAPRTRGG